jgi:hypothetical protein
MNRQRHVLDRRPHIQEGILFGMRMMIPTPVKFRIHIQYNQYRRLGIGYIRLDFV